MTCPPTHDPSRPVWDMPQKAVLEYAGVAQDLNDIHWSAEAAATAGFAGPVVHGMFMLGRLLVELERQVGVGEIASAAVRFVRPAVVGSRLAPVLTETVDGGFDIGVSDGSGTLAVSGTAQARTSMTARHEVADHADVVARRRLVVERGPAVRLASVLGADDTRYRPSAEAGNGAHRTVPSLGFVLPSWGFFPDLEGNEGQPSPDAVADCRRWCDTVQPVVHATQAFTFTRPLVVGEVVRADTRLGRRRTVESRGRRLRFTDVVTDLLDEHGEHVLTSDMGLVVIEAADPEELR